VEAAGADPGGVVGVTLRAGGGAAGGAMGGAVETGAAGGAGLGGAAGVTTRGGTAAAGVGADGVVAAAGGLASVAGGGVAGLAGGTLGEGAAVCCFARIAFSTSPGLEIFERSIFGLMLSVSGLEARADFAPCPSPEA
jgi:hypothetical protein